MGSKAPVEGLLASEQRQDTGEGGPAGYVLILGRLQGGGSTEKFPDCSYVVRKFLSERENVERRTGV